MSGTIAGVATWPELSLPPPTTWPRRLVQPLAPAAAVFSPWHIHRTLRSTVVWLWICFRCLSLTDDGKRGKPLPRLFVCFVGHQPPGIGMSKKEQQQASRLRKSVAGTENKEYIRTKAVPLWLLRVIDRLSFASEQSPFFLARPRISAEQAKQPVSRIRWKLKTSLDVFFCCFCFFFLFPTFFSCPSFLSPFATQNPGWNKWQAFLYPPHHEWMMSVYLFSRSDLFILSTRGDLRRHSSAYKPDNKTTSSRIQNNIHPSAVEKRKREINRCVPLSCLGVRVCVLTTFSTRRHFGLTCWLPSFHLSIKSPASFEITRVILDYRSQNGLKLGWKFQLSNQLFD